MKRRTWSNERQFPQFRHGHDRHDRDRLYTFRKNEYSTAAVEYEGAVPARAEGRLRHDRTWNGTRGISADGIQRNKVRAVDRTEHDPGSGGTQNHDPHSLEPACRSQGQPAYDYGDGPGAEHPH